MHLQCISWLRRTCIYSVYHGLGVHASTVYIMAWAYMHLQCISWLGRTCIYSVYHGLGVHASTVYIMAWAYMHLQCISWLGRTCIYSVCILWLRLLAITMPHIIHFVAYVLPLLHTQGIIMDTHESNYYRVIIAIPFSFHTEIYNRRQVFH